MVFNAKKSTHHAGRRFAKGSLHPRSNFPQFLNPRLNNRSWRPELRKPIFRPPPFLLPPVNPGYHYMGCSAFQNSPYIDRAPLYERVFAGFPPRKGSAPPSHGPMPPPYYFHPLGFQYLNRPFCYPFKQAYYFPLQQRGGDKGWVNGLKDCDPYCWAETINTRKKERR